MGSEASKMSEPDRTREREHWQAIAEQLGLAPDPEQPAEAREDSTVKEEIVPAEVGAGAEPGRALDFAPARESPTDTSPPLRPESTEPQQESEFAAAIPAGSDDEKAASRGRGKRRTQRSRSDGELDQARASKQRSRVEDEEPSRSSPRREKGRGRKGKGRPARAEREEAAIGAESKANSDTRPAETDDDDEGYGDWTVPSWSELIASLYRPEH